MELKETSLIFVAMVTTWSRLEGVHSVSYAPTHASHAPTSVNAWLVPMAICRVQHQHAPSVTVNAPNARRMRIEQSLAIGVYLVPFPLVHTAWFVPFNSIGVILLPYAPDAQFQDVWSVRQLRLALLVTPDTLLAWKPCTISGPIKRSSHMCACQQSTPMEQSWCLWVWCFLYFFKFSLDTCRD